MCCDFFREDNWGPVDAKNERGFGRYLESENPVAIFPSSASIRPPLNAPCLVLSLSNQNFAHYYKTHPSGKNVKFISFTSLDISTNYDKERPGQIIIVNIMVT